MNSFKFNTTKQNAFRAASAEAPSRICKLWIKSTPRWMSAGLGTRQGGQVEPPAAPANTHVLYVQLRAQLVSECSLGLFVEWKSPLSMPRAWVGCVVEKRTGVDRSASATSKLSRMG